MILHHIQTSPSNDNALQTCLRYAAQNDAVLLSGNGVTAILKRQWAMALAPFKVYLLKDDLLARGIASQADNYTCVDYNEFIALTLSHSKVITW